MNVLITGASGFVGSYLCPFLQDKGFCVFPVLRKHTKPLQEISLENHRFINGMDADTAWSDLVEGMDVVINLAARVHVMRDESPDPLSDFCKVNVDGVMALARQAAKAGVKQFIQFSSIKVNGEQTFGTPFSECSTTCPIDPYGVSKQMAEQQLQQFSDSAGMAVTIIRPPLIYGPGVKGNLQLLERAIRKGIPLPFGNVNNHRSMVSIYNLADLVARCIGNVDAFNHVFMAGDGESVSTSELVSYIGQGIGKPARLLPVPSMFLKTTLCLLGKRSLAVRLLGDLEVDISFTQKALEWHPPYSVKDSFSMMYADARRRG